MPHNKNNSKESSIGIIEKIIAQNSTSFEPIRNLNVEKMIENLNKKTTQEINLLKILEFKKSDEKCLEKHLFSILNNQK